MFAQQWIQQLTFSGLLSCWQRNYNPQTESLQEFIHQKRDGMKIKLGEIFKSQNYFCTTCDIGGSSFCKAFNFFQILFLVQKRL